MKFNFRVRRTRFFLLTSALLMFSVVLFVNVITMELQSDPSPKSEAMFLYNYNENAEAQQSKKSKVIEEFQVNFAGQGQRKPKTTNLDNDAGDFDDEQTDHTYYNDNTDSIKFNALDTDNEEFQNLVRTYEKNIANELEEEEDEDEDYDDESNEDDYNYDDENPENDNNNPNPVFKPGDFGDIRGLEYYRKPQLKFEDIDVKKENNEIKDVRHIVQVMEERKSSRKPAPSLIQNKHFWSSYVESLIPKGDSYSNITRTISSLRQQVVKTLQSPTWNKCGRPKNGFVIMGDGTHMCARYRHPHYAFVFGEALAFYLSRLLGMDNVPAVVLTTTDTAAQQWRGVNISTLEWEENKTVAFIQWIENLNSPGYRSRTFIPPLILKAYRTGEPVTGSIIMKSNPLVNGTAHMADIIQWGSMIIFDYLTGNYDRVASMQDAEDKEKNPKVIQESIRNLRKSSTNGKMWLIDNESGFFDAYELLESRNNEVTRFYRFHRQMLKTMCVFQSSFVNALRKLNASPHPQWRLFNFAVSLEPLLNRMPKDDKFFKRFVDMFPERLKEVIEWIDHCQSL